MQRHQPFGIVVIALMLASLLFDPPPVLIRQLSAGSVSHQARDLWWSGRVKR
jgi:hypothetical protein